MLGEFSPTLIVLILWWILSGASGFSIIILLSSQFNNGNTFLSQHLNCMKYLEEKFCGYF